MSGQQKEVSRGFAMEDWRMTPDIGVVNRARTRSYVRSRRLENFKVGEGTRSTCMTTRGYFWANRSMIWGTRTVAVSVSV